MVDSSSDSNSESSHQSSDDENDEDIYIPGYCDIILIDGSFSSPTILHNVHYTNDLMDALENEEALISSCADAEKSNREIEKAAYRKRLLNVNTPMSMSDILLHFIPESIEELQRWKKKRRRIVCTNDEDSSSNT